MAQVGHARPILAERESVNPTAVSGPTVISVGPLLPERSRNSGTGLGPVERIIPMRLERASVNQRLPSGPVVIPRRPLLATIPLLNSVTVPCVGPVEVIRPIRLPLFSVNQRLLSGPSVMPVGALPALMPMLTLTTPAVVMRPTRFPAVIVNHKAPSSSGPAATLV